MKILFITKEIPYPVNDGCRNRTFNILKGLSKNNNITLICFGNAERDSERIEGIKGLYSSIKLISQDSYNIRKKSLADVLLGLLSIVPFIVKSRFSGSMKTAIKEIIETERIDLVFCDSIYQAINMPVSSVTKILSEHNIESDILYRYFKVEKNFFKKVYIFIELLKMRIYESREWKKFDKCIVVSDKDRSAIEKRTKKQSIIVVPNGVDIEYFQPKKKDEIPNSLIYTGLMSWYPNEDAMTYFLESIYPIIRREVAVPSLMIVGKDPSDRLKKTASSDRSITITGTVVDIRPFISESEVFIVPLRIGSGTRLKILEAMAMGKTIVSTSVGCEGLDVKHDDNILIAKDEEDFAGLTVRALGDAGLRDRIGNAARLFVEKKYSWEELIKILEKI